MFKITLITSMVYLAQAVRLQQEADPADFVEQNVPPPQDEYYLELANEATAAFQSYSANSRAKDEQES